MRLYCWNVNGIRAVQKKGFKEWLLRESPDVLCVQETKASLDKIPTDLLSLPGYRSHFVAPKEKSGYSGVGIFTKVQPERILPGMGIERFDMEGRLQEVHFPDFVLFNVYFPNGKQSVERLRYKMDFYESFLSHCQDLMGKGKEIVVCGDVNTAHKEIDLARPKENSKVSGFLPEERDWIDRFLAAGFVDSFRVFDASPDRYTWWDMKSGARERNVGWRIDAFYVTQGLLPRLHGAFIMTKVMGSDHCPIGIELD